MMVGYWGCQGCSLKLLSLTRVMRLRRSTAVLLWTESHLFPFAQWREEERRDRRGRKERGRSFLFSHRIKENSNTDRRGRHPKKSSRVRERDQKEHQKTIMAPWMRATKERYGIGKSACVGRALCVCECVYQRNTTLLSVMVPPCCIHFLPHRMWAGVSKHAPLSGLLQKGKWLNKSHCETILYYLRFTQPLLVSPATFRSVSVFIDKP